MQAHDCKSCACDVGLDADQRLSQQLNDRKKTGSLSTLLPSSPRLHPHEYRQTFKGTETGSAQQHVQGESPSAASSLARTSSPAAEQNARLARPQAAHAYETPRLVIQR